MKFGRRNVYGFARICLAGAIAFVVVVAALSRTYAFGVDGPVTHPTDFVAFSCGGEAVAHGANPYRVEPLRTCQRESMRSNGLRLNDGHVLTAPLPPYALLAFAAFSKLPFRLATECWLALNIVALALAILGAVKLSALRLWFVALVLLPSLGFASLVIGQLVPVAVAALVFAALCARRGDGTGAALGVAVASLEPHLALPAWCALALFVPRSRAPLGIAAAVLCAMSFAAGPALSGEYFTQVLPQHARSEVYDFAAQYSLTSLLAAAGVPAAAALRLGSLSYACALGGGVWLGRAMQRRYDDRAFLIATPTAAVLLGGPFVHAHQMAAALPFALMLLGRLPSRTALHGVVFAAVCALAVPWESIAEMPVVADRLSQNVRVGATVPALRRATASESAELPYTAFMDAFAERSEPRTVLEQLITKLPTWYALIALLAVGSALVFRRSVSLPEALAPT